MNRSAGAQQFGDAPVRMGHLSHRAPHEPYDALLIAVPTSNVPHPPVANKNWDAFALRRPIREPRRIRWRQYACSKSR